MTGRLFDEVVPTAECLSQSLSEEARLPMSCKFLLSSYHYLSVRSPDGRVSASAWISFWNHSVRSYVGHEAVDRSTSKSVCPRKLLVFEHRPWDAGDRHPFDTIRVSSGLEEEVYCVVFLTCWLCVFVFPAEPLGLFVLHGKGTGLPTGVRPSAMVFQSSRSSSSTVDDRDSKHTRGAQEDTSSSRGSRVASPIHKSTEAVTPSVIPDKVIRHQEHTELVDIGESPECLVIEVAESHAPAPPSLSIAQGAKTILRTGASSLWACICDGLQGKSPEMGFFQEEREMIVASIAISPADASEILQKLSLLRCIFLSAIASSFIVLFVAAFFGYLLAKHFVWNDMKAVLGHG
ncbi:hypothetical protein LIER_29957 [Lithospermum erythrorhizon]|uniref:Uncharacterized protein n=1 Tax=Lithospermum erythrorhizon TaxID=34254 RepID=A0AAV3RP84_LITER